MKKAGKLALSGFFLDPRQGLKLALAPRFGEAKKSLIVVAGFPMWRQIFCPKVEISLASVRVKVSITGTEYRHRFGP